MCIGNICKWAAGVTSRVLNAMGHLAIATTPLPSEALMHRSYLQVQDNVTPPEMQWSQSCALRAVEQTLKTSQLTNQPESLHCAKRIVYTSISPSLLLYKFALRGIHTYWCTLTCIHTYIHYKCIWQRIIASFQETRVNTPRVVFIVL